MSINDFLTITVIVLTVFSAVFGLYAASKKRPEESKNKINTFEKITEHITQKLIEIDKDDYSVTMTDDEFERSYRRRARIKTALANSIHGIESAKVIVIDLIRNIIIEDISSDTISNVLKLDGNSVPSPEVQFEVLLYKFKKKYQKQALSQFINKYAFALRRDDDKAAYYISEKDLSTAYALENPVLTAEEKADLLAILVFQRVKGFGTIDTIREMDIDGINIGTSGALIPQIKQELSEEFRVERSVWIFYRGKQIHLRFLSLGTEDEIRRIALNIIRFGGKGALTRKDGRITVTAPDKARIVALCPPASECWAVFIRKFGFSGKSPKELLIKEETKNGQLVVNTIEYLMRGMITSGITGRQGSGKTTLMSSIICYIDPCYTIRTLEMSFEMYLRDMYPERNILAVQETSNISASVLQDALKKTDAAVSIVGEVATDDVAARMIQMGQVASLFTLFSHHANTTDDLIMALRNSLVNAGGFSSMETAERQVIDVIKVDVHLDSTPDGQRYVDRITEIVPLPPGMPYPEYIPNNPQSMDLITKEYYERKTDRKSFTTRQILHYDLDSNTYIPDNPLSEKMASYMKRSMGEKYRNAFTEFLAKNWEQGDEK